MQIRLFVDCGFRFAREYSAMFQPGFRMSVSRGLILGLSLAVLAMCGAAAAKDWWDYPDIIETLEIKGDPRELVVTKSARLQETFVPANLVRLVPEVIRTDKPVEVCRDILGPLRELRLAAEKDGIDLVVLSGYRSFERQKIVHQYWLDREKGDQAAADRYSARAGHSEHQLGTVVDFSTNEIDDAIGPQFDTTRAAQWLRKHAGKYGFRLSYPKCKEAETGYQWESWHWRWWPEKE